MDINASNPVVEDAESSNATKSSKEKNPYKYLMLGIWLVALGTLWLLWNVRAVNWAWIERYGFIIFGVFLLAKTVILKKYHLFWGGTLLLIGCFHIYLDQAGDFKMRELWPMYLLIAGMMFMVNFIIDLKRWFSLVAGMFLLVFGGAYISRTYFMMPYEIIMWIKLYWPLTFVAAGLILVAIAIIKSRK